MNEKQAEFTALCANPTRFFTSPAQVVTDLRLSLDQKREILDAWEFDSRKLLVAEGEGLDGGERDQLRAVIAARELLEQCRRGVHENG